MAFTGRVLPLKQGSEAYRAIRQCQPALTLLADLTRIG